MLCTLFRPLKTIHLIRFKEVTAQKVRGQKVNGKKVRKLFKKKSQKERKSENRVLQIYLLEKKF